jgi:hypothetical protein
MEAAVTLAERLMSQYEGRLSLKQICEEILVVLQDGGLRIGDPVPLDLAIDAEARLADVSERAARDGREQGSARIALPSGLVRRG